MSTAPVFSKLYYFFHELIGGTVFVDQDAALVGWSTNEDAESSLELVAKHFNVTIMQLPGAWLVPEDEDDEFDADVAGGDEDEAVMEFVDRNAEMILEAIKQAHIDANDVAIEDAEEEEFEETEIVNHVGPVGDAVQQRDEEQKEEETMSKKKTAAKKTSAKKSSAKKIAPATKQTQGAPSPVKKVAKAKKPAKKTPVKGAKPGKKPAKGGGKKK